MKGETAGGGMADEQQRGRPYFLL